MKKKMKRLMLHRETLRSLSTPNLSAVRGATVVANTFRDETNTPCCSLADGESHCYRACETVGCPDTNNLSACGTCEV
jgi:hypothetical protein